MRESVVASTSFQLMKWNLQLKYGPPKVPSLLKKKVWWLEKYYIYSQRYEPAWK